MPTVMQLKTAIVSSVMATRCFWQEKESAVVDFQVAHQDGLARRGRTRISGGAVQTPTFMPVGTYGTVKGMLPRDIVGIGAEIILGNTFLTFGYVREQR